jgi:RHS repeat-associated protein
VNRFQYTGREFDSETGLYFYRARYNDSTLGRFISEDPIRFAGSSDFYMYAQNRPINAIDPTGLKILICSRPSEHMLGNHGFLYDTRNGHNCGKGSGNFPNGHDSANNANTFCVEVPGSAGLEDNVMNCCIKNAGSFSGRFGFFPWVHDCQNLAGDCLTANGLKNPGVPGGRLGCPGNCPPPPPPPQFPNPPRCSGFSCLDNR